MQTARYRIGILGVVALVALRLGIGWHFFQEGAAKVQDGKFSSVGFLSAAKGPLAPAYHDLVWDADGFFRLQEEDTVKAWEAHAAQVAEHFEFDTQQRAEAEAIVERYKGQLKTFFDVNEDDLYEYEEGLRRREEYRGWAEDLTPEERNANRAWTEVPSLRGQLTSHEAELKKKAAGWLRTIDTMWSSFERELNELAYEDQAVRGYVSAPRPGRRVLDSVTIDRFIPYFDLAIGGLLILGLLTRLAAVAGAAFLLSVILSQYPLSPEATATYYQSIEMLGLLVLAGTAAGRFAGLDYLLSAVRQRCCAPKQES